MKILITTTIVVEEEAIDAVLAHISKLVLNPRVSEVSSTHSLEEYVAPELTGVEPCISEELNAQIVDAAWEEEQQRNIEATLPTLLSEKEQALFNHLKYGDAERNSVLESMILASDDEHVQLAFKAMEQGHNSKSIIYLMGGNNPSTNPFVSQLVGENL